MNFDYTITFMACDISMKCIKIGTTIYGKMNIMRYVYTSYIVVMHTCICTYVCIQM